MGNRSSSPQPYTTVAYQVGSQNSDLDSPFEFQTMKQKMQSRPNALAGKQVRQGRKTERVNVPKSAYTKRSSPGRKIEKIPLPTAPPTLVTRGRGRRGSIQESVQQKGPQSPRTRSTSPQRASHQVVVDVVRHSSPRKPKVEKVQVQDFDAESELDAITSPRMHTESVNRRVRSASPRQQRPSSPTTAKVLKSKYANRIEGWTETEVSTASTQKARGVRTTKVEKVEKTTVEKPRKISVTQVKTEDGKLQPAIERKVRKMKTEAPKESEETIQKCSEESGLASAKPESPASVLWKYLNTP